MANYSERINFFKGTAEHLYNFDTKSRKLVEELVAPAKKINVSSAYAVLNRVGHTTTEINSSVRAIMAAIDTCVQTIKANRYNEGEFDEIVNNALKVIGECMPGTFTYDEVSTSADGNESMTQANLDALVDVLTSFTKLSRDTLMDVSAARGPMRGEDNQTVINIGKNLEDFTNSVVLQCQAITDQVAQMAVDYGLEIKKLEEATDALKSISATDVHPDISFSGDKF